MKKIINLVYAFSLSTFLIGCCKKDNTSTFACYILVDTVAYNPPQNIPAHYPITISQEGIHENWTDEDAHNYREEWNSKQIIQWQNNAGYKFRLDCYKSY